MKVKSGWCSRAVAALALLCAAGGTSAADLGFYVTLDSSMNSTDVTLSNFNDATYYTLYYLSSGAVTEPPTDVGKDTRSRSYNFTVGYQLGSYFAIEGSYIRLGKFSYSYKYPGAGSDGTDLMGRWKISSGGPTVAAVGLLPLGPYFSVDAHAGFFFLENKHVVTYGDDKEAGDGDREVEEFSDSKTAPYYGAGVSWWITGQVALRLGYNNFYQAVKYRGPFTESIFKKDATQYTLGIRYSYGY